MKNENFALPGLGAATLKNFHEAGIENPRDLFFYLPRRYEDRRELMDFEALEARVGQQVFGRARVERYTWRFGGGRRWLEAIISIPSTKDPRAAIHFLWFHKFGASIQKAYPAGTEIFFTGKLQEFRGRLQIAHPEISKDAEKIGLGSIVPIYSRIEGFTQRKLREMIQACIEKYLFTLNDPIPEWIQKKHSLAELAVSIQELHNPQRWNPLQLQTTPHYLRRLIFDEFFFFALGLEKLRLEQMNSAVKCLAVKKNAEVTAPFELTGDQKRSIQEIESDLSSAKKPMHRLLQGDVGSGKTIVAFISMIYTAQSKYQSAIIAPTQIVATQHYENFLKFFAEFAHDAILITAATSAAERKILKEKIRSGSAKYIFGTTALLSHLSDFHSLALLIVDEQHRFGVEQRRALTHQQSVHPHLLVMTATPIPRSLALTLYGDLQVSTLKEKPPFRKEVKSFLLHRKQRPKIVERVRELLDSGKQAFLVYPIIEDSDLLEDVESVSTAYRELSETLAPHSLGLLHGRLKAAEKDRVLKNFREGKIRALVSTTVIEVGVDIPSASIMVIEHAERFGLSQLHQLRGRVGRGDEEGLCILIAPDEMQPETEARLQSFIETTSGFEIAEKDLILRGPGDFLGTRQSGATSFKTAHLIRDLKTLEEAKAAARELIERDPKLASPQGTEIAGILQRQAEAIEHLHSG